MTNRALLFAAIGFTEGLVWWAIGPFDRPAWMSPTAFGGLAAISSFALVPSTLDVSPGLLRRLAPDGPGFLRSCSPDRCLLLGVDLDADTREERCVIAAIEQYVPDIGPLYTRCYALDGRDDWESIGRLANVATEMRFEDLKRELERSGPVLRPSRFREIQIGNGAFVLAPDARLRSD